MKVPLAEMAKRARPTRKRAITFQTVALPAMQATNLYREAYAPIIAVWRNALPGIEAEYARTLAALQTDSAATLEAEIDRTGLQAGAVVLAMRARIEAWARLAEAWHRARWRRAVLSATGVDLTTLIGPEDMRETLGALIARNVGLVSSVSDQTRQRIADAVFRGLQARTPSRELARELAGAVDMGRKRALRIAADQNAKLSSALNEERRRQAGVDSFRWVHSRKKHPRPEHEARDGKLYSENTARVGQEYEGQIVRKVPEDRPGELPFCGCTTKAVLILENGEAVLPNTTVQPNRSPPSTRPNNADLAQLDREGKADVLARGRREGVEHLYAYNAATGEKFSIASGTTSAVTIPDDVREALQRSGSEVVIHHNHPSGNSLSPADIKIGAAQPGSKGIWAHGHDGSSYFAGRVRVLSDEEIMNVWKQAEQNMQRAVDQGIIKPADASKIFPHIVNLALGKKELIEYRFRLSAAMQRVVSRNQRLVNIFLEGL